MPLKPYYFGIWQYGQHRFILSKINLYFLVYSHRSVMSLVSNVQTRHCKQAIKGKDNIRYKNNIYKYSSTGISTTSLL